MHTYITLDVHYALRTDRATAILWLCSPLSRELGPSCRNFNIISPEFRRNFIRTHGISPESHLNLAGTFFSLHELRSISMFMSHVWQIVKPLWQTWTLHPFFIWPKPKAISQLVLGNPPRNSFACLSWSVRTLLLEQSLNQAAQTNQSNTSKHVQCGWFCLCNRASSREGVLILRSNYTVWYVILLHSMLLYSMICYTSTYTTIAPGLTIRHPWETARIARGGRAPGGDWQHY